MNIKNYGKDGADNQARAVLAYVSNDIEESWDGHKYTAEIEVARWENCREQGYVLMLSVHQRQLNIIFFEHRNSDGIAAVKWEQRTLNAPTIESADFGVFVYTDKYDTSFSVSYGEVTKMAQWIDDEFIKFYDSNFTQINKGK